MVDFILFDFWIALFAGLTTSIVSIASFHSYHIGKRLRQSHFGFGFLLLTISLFFGMLLNARIQYPLQSSFLAPLLPLDLVGGWFVIISTVFLFSGLLVVYMTLERIHTQRTVLLLHLLILLTLLVGQNIFPAVYTMLIILIACVLIHFYWNWREQPNPTSFLMMAGFFCTFVAHSALMFDSLHSTFTIIYYAGNGAAIFCIFSGTAYLYVKSAIYKHMR